MGVCGKQPCSLAKYPQPSRLASNPRVTPRVSLCICTWHVQPVEVDGCAEPCARTDSSHSAPGSPTQLTSDPIGSNPARMALPSRFDASWKSVTYWPRPFAPRDPPLGLAVSSSDSLARSMRSRTDDPPPSLSSLVLCFSLMRTDTITVGDDASKGAHRRAWASCLCRSVSSCLHSMTFDGCGSICFVIRLKRVSTKYDT